MANVEWGKKRRCVECGAAFYDMQRTPIACPKCGVTHEPVVLLKPDGRPPRKNRVRPPPPPPAEAEAAPEPAEADLDEPDETADDRDIDDDQDSDQAADVENGEEVAETNGRDQ